LGGGNIFYSPVIEIRYRLRLSISTEKLLIRPESGSIRGQTLLDTTTEIQLFLNLAMHHRVEQHRVCFLTDAVHTPCSLDQFDDGPRQIEVHDNVRLLQVLTLRKHICRHEHSNLICWCHRLLIVAHRVCFRRESTSKSRSIL